MKLKKRLLAAGLALILMFSCTACTYDGKVVYFELPSSGKVVFKIGDMKCLKDEALIYLINAKNIYGTVEGVNLWENDFNTDIMCDSLKDEVLEHITRVYVLDIYAAENEITLTDSEIEKCQEAADEYYASLTDSEIEFTGTTNKKIEAMYERYALAEKVYVDLMDSVDEEVSEDEARIMEAYVLFVTDEAEAEEIQGMIDYGYTFERLAATYTTLDTYQVTFGRNEYPDAVDEVVFNLDTDEVSGAIEADGGYYFFQCLDKYNEELSEANKTVIINARRASVLADIVSDLQDRYYSDINTDLWDQLSISSEDASGLSTSTFFSTLSDHISY